MFNRLDPKNNAIVGLRPMDRMAVAYVTAPLILFLIGWFEWWVAAPLVLCVGYSLAPMFRALPSGAPRSTITPLKLWVAVAVGCAWTLCGGADHLLFANTDWHLRDAVLHDLVVSPWPVGYGLLNGQESILRAPVAFYLPAALVGKWLGVSAAHIAMGLWTALGASLFLMQVLSLVPSRTSTVVLTAGVVVFFSGFDIIGNIINTGPRFLATWDIVAHLEWWAGSYQYSSMTTQLFWVPNHALGAWLVIGLMSRNPRWSLFDALLPILLVAAALWSPLSAVGLMPFVLWRVYGELVRARNWRLLYPRVWGPAIPVGLAVASYLVLDPGGIPKGLAVGKGGAIDTLLDLLRQAQFFFLEAGFIGFVIWWILPSSEVVLALVVLAVLPFVRLGPANDFVMRASIPSLAILAIGACLALSVESADRALRNKQIVLACFLTIGAVTAVQEFARAIVLNAWPMNLHASLPAAACGHYPPHYIAKLDKQTVRLFMQPPHRLTDGEFDKESCSEPAVDLLWRRGLL
jgi:hypothetical protein